MPPQDPVNAMLSYGYAVLSHSLHAAISLARLHAGFGHLHASAGNRPALACAEGCGKTSLFRMMRAQVACYGRAVADGPPLWHSRETRR